MFDCTLFIGFSYLVDGGVFVCAFGVVYGAVFVCTDEVFCENEFHGTAGAGGAGGIFFVVFTVLIVLIVVVLVDKSELASSASTFDAEDVSVGRDVVDGLPDSITKTIKPTIFKHRT